MMDWPFIFLLHCALWACSILIGHAYRSSGSGQLGVPTSVGGPRSLSGCLFPERWEGTWFQSGVRQPIIIEGSRLSNKGTCLGSEGDKFVVVDDKRVCYRCVVIHEKHANVLQYKETYCHGRDSLPTICSLITGDALLYSMFREGALPVPCPFRGPFTFTYNRGHGECRNPVSTIDACTEDSRLLLSYQACPDVYGTESTVEELQCLATWKEGSSRYLVGKVHHSHATSNEDRFRCFVYEKIGGVNEGRESSSMSRLGSAMGSLASSSHRERLIAGDTGRQTLDLDVDYKVAQSGDATCNGLFSASEGSRTMTLRKAPLQNKCRFPQFLSISQHWHTLDYGGTWSFHHRNSTLRISNATSGQEMKVTCSQHQTLPHQLKHLGSNAEIIVAHFTMGCQNGEICMLFYRRDTHVVEIQLGSHVRRPEDACAPQHFDRATSPFITLVTTSPEPRACPFPGKFQITSVSPIDHRARRSVYHRDHGHYRHQEPGNIPLADGGVFKSRIKRIDKPGGQCSTGWTYDRLTIGCTGADTMEFDLTCNGGDRISAYSCHGSWEENSTLYVITTPLSRASHGARRHCFMYRRASAPSSLYETSTSNNNKRDGNSNNKNVPQDGDRTPLPLILQLASSTEGCDRNFREDQEGVVIFNSTQTGACIETNNKDRPELSLSLILILMLPTLINYVLLQDNR